jgi:hypothetical protein
MALFPAQQPSFAVDNVILAPDNVILPPITLSWMPTRSFYLM